jgi:tetratricopeptide (TPR) repeat protein
MKKASLQNVFILLLTVILLSGCSMKTAGYYNKEGIKNLKSGSYEAAEKNLSKAIELNKERADYYINYAMSLVMLGKYEKAQKYFNKAILKKDNTIVNKNKKKAYRGKGIAYFEACEYTKAIKQFDKALAIDELSSFNMDILYYKGKAQEKVGLYENAVETFTEIIKLNSKDADIYNSRAFVYRMLGEDKKSLADYDKAIILDASNYNYYFGKYSILLESDKEGATVVLEDAEKITAKTQEDKFNLAKVHYYMRNYDTAMDELKEASKNGFTAAYYYLGDIYQKKEDYKTAVEQYKLFVDKAENEKSAAVYNQLGVSEMKLENYDDALTAIQAGLELNDSQTEQSLMHNEIAAYEKLGKFEKANEVMDKYLALYPKDKDAIKEFEFIKTRLPEVSK